MVIFASYIKQRYEFSQCNTLAAEGQRQAVLLRQASCNAFSLCYAASSILRGWSQSSNWFQSPSKWGTRSLGPEKISFLRVFFCQSPKPYWHEQSPTGTTKAQHGITPLRATNRSTRGLTQRGGTRVNMRWWSSHLRRNAFSQKEKQWINPITSSRQ